MGSEDLRADGGECGTFEKPKRSTHWLCLGHTRWSWGGRLSHLRSPWWLSKLVGVGRKEQYGEACWNPSPWRIAVSWRPAWVAGKQEPLSKQHQAKKPCWRPLLKEYRENWERKVCFHQWLQFLKLLVNGPQFLYAHVKNYQCIFAYLKKSNICNWYYSIL